MSDRRVLAPEGLHDAAPSGYSHGILVGDTVYVSGQIGRVGGLEEQAEAALEGVRLVVAEAGGTMADVVKLNVFTTEDDCWPRTAELRDKLLPQPWPAITLVMVRNLAAPGLLIEIEAVAVVDSGGSTA